MSISGLCTVIHFCAACSYVLETSIKQHDINKIQFREVRGQNNRPRRKGIPNVQFNRQVHLLIIQRNVIIPSICSRILRYFLFHLCVGPVHHFERTSYALFSSRHFPLFEGQHPAQRRHKTCNQRSQRFIWPLRYDQTGFPLSSLSLIYSFIKS